MEKWLNEKNVAAFKAHIQAIIDRRPHRSRLGKALVEISKQPARAAPSFDEIDRLTAELLATKLELKSINKRLCTLAPTEEKPSPPVVAADANKFRQAIGL